MQAALTTTLASETAADHKTEDSETITTDHRTMAGSEMATTALTVASASAITTAALTVVSAAAIAAPATTVVSATAAVRTTAASEAEEAISSVATAAAA